jgi:amidase
MDRREFVRTGLATGALAGTSRVQGGPGVLAAAATPGPAPKFGTGGILDAGVWEQQELMAAGKLTSHSLTSQYLARIKTIVNAVIEINPEALKIALEMDRERKLKRLRGPLHGIPVLIKDNISTADRMSTSAGPLALPGARAERDAHVAERLRAAGAVIIGKTNLGDWVQLGGGDPAASSSSAGPAIAAGLATLAVGTETNGAILAPASNHGLVGIKPTPGLVSRSGIIPLAPVDDTAGPMARSVTDAALMLWAIAGADPADPATAATAGKVVDYRMALEKGGLQGARIGVARHLFGADPARDVVIEKALLDLKAQGAQLVDVALPAAGADDKAAVQCTMRAHGIDALVAPTGAGLPAPAGVSGYPHITVPAGHVQGQPVGLSFVGAAYSEAALIRMAYSYEQATLHRRAPQFPASVSFAAR